MSQTAAQLVAHVIPPVPVRQGVLSQPIPLRVLLAAQPELVTPVLQVARRGVTRHLLRQAGPRESAGAEPRPFMSTQRGPETTFGGHGRWLRSASRWGQDCPL